MKRVLGYSDGWSVVPGTKIGFKVSTYGPERYRADLVRVISGEDEGDVVRSLLRQIRGKGEHTDHRGAEPWKINPTPR